MSEKYDIVIIGSGLGGLVSSIILAKEGYNVCVLEKNQQFGGNLQTFSRDKVIFDTGVHYIGGLDEGQNLNRYFKYLGILDDLSLKKMDEDAYDIITFDDDPVEYKHAQGYERFTESLLEQFPDEGEAIEAYRQKMTETCDSFPLYRMRHSAAYHENPEIFQEQIKHFIESITDNEKLQSVLVGSNLLYAGDGDKTPLYMHALAVNSYIESSYRIIRGGSQITKALLKRLRELGGKALKRQEVVKIETEDGVVTQVQTQSGEIYKADLFISNVDPKMTLDMLPSDLFRKSYVRRIENIESTIAAFSLYLVLKPNTFKYLNSNYYHFKDTDSVWNALHYTQEDWPRTYMVSMGISEEDEEWADNLTLMTYMRYDEVAPWADTFNTVVNKNDRGETYEEFKAAKTEILLDELEKKFPNIRDCIEATYTSTPLSYRDYIGCNKGAMYGFVKDASNPMKSLISPRTKVKNLFFTGQSLNMHGILGVTIGGVVTCSEILGREYLLNKILEETAEEVV